MDTPRKKMGNKHMKILEKCKLKPQRCTTTYLLEYLRLKRPTIASVGKVAELEFSYITG